MRRRISFATITMFLSAMLLFTLSSRAAAQGLQRLMAEFLKFDNGELHAGPSDTVAIDNGVAIFEDHVSVPSNVNILYVTLSATGDLNGTDVESWFSCVVDGSPCNSGKTFATDTDGWIALQGGSDTVHDNVINYTWCTPIAPLHGEKGKAKFLHDVQLRMASNGNGTAYIEGMHVFVDANSVKNASQACAEGTH